MIWCNDQWLDPLDFAVSPTDRGLMHGFGLFETILAVDGVPVFAERHLERLRAGCGRLGWKWDYPEIRGVMDELIERNGLGAGRSRIRLAVTAGSGLIHSLAQGEDRVVWMTAVAAAEPPAATTANVSRWLRNERSALAGIKCASYAENLLALEEAARSGFEETVFLNTAGHVCEAATSNVFLVRDGVLGTPSLDSGCLPGITRQVVIGLAGKLGISCEEGSFSADDLRGADEVFLTSSIRGVMAVSRLEGRDLAAGAVTCRLRDEWAAAVEDEVRG